MKTLLQYNTDLRLVNLPVIDNWRYLDTLTVQVQFLPDNTLPTGATISLALKEQSEFSQSDGIVVIEGFSLNAQTGYWEAELLLSTEALVELFETNPNTVTLYSNVLVEVGETHWFQGPTQEFIIQNQYTRGTEPTPIPGGGLDAWLSERAVLFDRDQNLTDEQEVQAQNNIGQEWDSNDSQFLIETQDGQKSVPGF